MKEVVSSFKGHQGWKEEKTSGAAARPWPINAWPPKSGASGRRETSIGRSLATMREAHQKALAMAAALEGEIERLSHALLQSWLEVRVRSKSKDHWIHGSMECKKRHCQVQFNDSPTPYHPLETVQSLVRGDWPQTIQMWESHWNLSQGLPLSLEDQQRVQGKRDPLLNCH